jgi:antitoxin HigA-1
MTKDPDLKPIHPGEILRTEFLEPLNISPTELARRLKVDEPIVKELITEKRSVDIELAYRLFYCFGVSAQFWLNFQRDYDLETYPRQAEIKKEIKPYPRAERTNIR